MQASTTIAWTIAASGERAPARMLVAVRASAPVAAMPPKNGATMLARPWPTSSASGSCRLPVMPSAMTAERSDSIAPSMAIANAEGRSFSTRRKVNGPSPHGSCGSGGSGGMPATSCPPMVVWNRVPSVSAGTPSAHAANVTVPIATSGAGTRRVRRGARRRSASVAAATPHSTSEALPRAAHRAATLSGKRSGMRATCRPSTSFSWRVAITVAMPAVKPVVTGCGMNSTSRPRRAAPIPTSRRPAMRPAVRSPERPKRDTIGPRTTTKAAVGPVTWNLDPPVSAATVPATIAV